MLTRCATRSLSTSFGLTKCVMPKRSPHSFLPLLMSTPMIMSAPASRSPWMTLRPMPPSPNTTDLEHLGGVEDGADAGGDAAADVANFVERGVFANFRDCDLGQHRATCPCNGAISYRRARSATCHRA